MVSPIVPDFLTGRGALDLLSGLALKGGCLMVGKRQAELSLYDDRGLGPHFDFLAKAELRGL